MKYFSRIALALSISFVTYNVIGQSHGWTVNPAEFSHSGEVTAIVFVGPAEVTTGTLGAFVNGICRGFNNGAFFPPSGKTVFTVICYSNVVSGETLNFKYYNPINDSIYDVNETIEFEADMVKGNAMAPLEFHVTLCEPVTIATQPSGAGMCTEKGEASFTVSAGGTAPFTYQWEYFNGTTWGNVTNGTPAGATYTNSTTETLGVSGNTEAGNYQYRCYITNCSGSSNATSNSATLTVHEIPTAPTVTLSHTTCETATGKITVTAPLEPGMTYSIDGSTYTNDTGVFDLLTPGTYTVTAKSSAGCISGGTVATINPQPLTPSPPLVGTITHPTCEESTGSVVLTGLPSGSWTLIRTPGSTETAGSGTSTTVSGIPSGTYTFTVTNSDGCTSSPSAEVVINAQPPAPAPPVLGTITQPTCDVATGSVELSGLPSSGIWTITRSPGGVETTGSGASVTISDLPTGSYTFAVTNAEGCTSGSSAVADIKEQPPSPASPVESVDCSQGFGNAVVTVISPTGTGLEYSLDGGPYQSGTVFTGVANGTHAITVRNSAGCTTTGSSFDITCGCVNPPTVSLSSTSGSTCSTESITVAGNTFGGSATSVTITDNGAGTVSPASSGTSPFSFTYTPAGGDAGNTVTITVTTNNPLGDPCAAATATYTLTVNVTPSVPSVGTITHPTCTVSTGSVILSGLPSSGTWTITRIPGEETTTGSGISTTISDLPEGVYTFTVTSAAGCASGSSANVVINSQPPTPTAPVIGTITPPTCTVSTGSVELSGLPSTGTWTITRTPGGVTNTGTGTSTTISTIPSGNYTFTVTNSDGCISASSDNVVIPEQPPIPSAPAIGTITPPSCTVYTGSVVLSGLPAIGIWTLTLYPGTVTATGSGISTTVSGLGTGIYNFTVTNDAGCTSSLSSNVVIPAQPPIPSPPVVGTITHPTCEESTGSVVLTGLPSGSWTLIRTPGSTETAGSGTSTTVSGIPSGTYTFTVTNSDGCTSSPSAEVVINAQPPAPAPPVVGTITQPTCDVATGSVELSGLPSSGIWTITRSPGGVETTGSGTSVTISDLPTGSYTFAVTNAEGCTSGSSAVADIKEQPPSPASPVESVDCSQGSGNAIVTVISPTGTGLEYSLDGGPFQSGTVFTGVANGSHTITVRNSAGCTTTGSSFDISCGCVNPPTVSLSSTSGSTCSTESITVAGNTFGGSATSVAITDNGAGTVSPASTGTSPFSFTYTPAGGDAGNTVTITVTTNNPLEAPCAAATATYTLTVNVTPSVPSVGTITHPTCTVSTGSVILSGLPSSGTWTITHIPGGETTTGSGISTTISDLPEGTYTFTVTNSAGCTSSLSANVVINPQPPTPTRPVIGTITPPTCTVSTGSVELSGLPSTGTWTITRTPGGVTNTGTGTSTTISTIPSGNYTFTVTNSDGCISASSDNVVIPEQPPIPAAPAIGTITPPSCTVSTGSVVLSGLPASGTWTLTRSPGGIITTGSGTSVTISDLTTGSYTFTVTNAEGCTSGSSAVVDIKEQPSSPASPVESVDCSLGFGNAQVTVISPTGTGLEYSLDGGPFQSGTLFTGVANGSHAITVRNSFGCTTTGNSFDISCGCVNPPTVTLSSTSGNTCSTETITVSGNTFGGSATSVTITENGAGTVSPASTGTRPFSFTYTPAAGDAGNIVTITVTTDNPLGEPCAAATATYTLRVNPTPSAPLVGNITHPTCAVSTGSVILNGLPSSGTWTITRSPGGETTNGSGTTVTISGLNAGTYTFTVTNAAGCTSASSANVVINPQPPTPTAPLVGTITHPTCAVSTGGVELSGLPSTGTWILTRYPGILATSGTGTSANLSGLLTGTYNYTVTNDAGCVSVPSDNVEIPSPPPVPSAPVVGTITQPTCETATGSVILSGLPSTGTWTLTRSPGGETTSGTGTSTTVIGLPAGTYTFTVTNAGGCTSASSSNVVINTQPPTPSAPVVGTITHPTCTLASGSVLLTGLPSTGTWTLTRDPGAVTTSGNGTSATITGLPEGTYTFTVTNSVGCISIASNNVVINAQPPSPVSPVQTVDCSLGFGNAIVTVTSPTGEGLEYRLNTGPYQTGTSFANVANGNHTITVRNSLGCMTTGTVFLVSCGCADPPLVTLSSISGSTCGTTPVTISGNTFGGSATSVTITENGAGSVSPASASVSPFSFTYTPAASDAGKTIIITVTTNNPSGVPCMPATATFALLVNQIPPAPSIGTRTHPTCTVSTGRVILNGLPSTGTWTLTRNPGGVNTNGTGTSTTVTGLEPGIYTFTVTSAAGCTSPSSANVVINPQPPTPAPPVLGAIIQPTCALSTGSAVLNDLPSSGVWTVTRNPGAVTKTGTGTSNTISALPEGTYTFMVTNSFGCTSESSEELVIDPQPPTPIAPSVGTITPPTCALETGSVDLIGLPATGIWTLTRYPGTVTTTGSGTSTTISELITGTYNYTVTNEHGCVSVPSANIVIPEPPPTPEAPVVETITQPSFEVPLGSVELSGLPSGTWTLTRYPGEVITTGSGTTIIITELPAGVFTFTVTNSFGCTSMSSSQVIISTPGIPVLIINNPDAVCAPETVDLTTPEITEGSTPGLIFTYWYDPDATVPFETPETAVADTYYIKGTTVSGFFDTKPVIVKVFELPVANAGPDQILDYHFETFMNAVLGDNETGVWERVAGSGNVLNELDPKTPVRQLTLGENVFRWTVTNEICPAASEFVTIRVRDLVIPTLITPNMDGKNDYFVILGLETLGITELNIFDRRGMQVYTNQNYKNDWDGVDYNNNPLPDDTYFYILKPQNGTDMSGYVVIRR